MDKNHFLITGLILVLGMALSLFIARKFHEIETETIRADFRKAIDEDVFMIEQEMKLNFEALYVLKTLFDSSNEVTPVEFRSAARSILARHEKILALAWHLKVTVADRQNYEKLRQREIPGFRITEFRDKTLQPAREREVYFPVSYLEPVEGNESARGFDVASDPTRLEALMAAMDSGTIQATRGIVIARKPFQSKGFLAVLPVYKGEPIETEERRKAIRGFIVGVFLYEEILDQFIARTVSEDIEIKLVGRDNVTLYEKNPERTEYAHHRTLDDIAGRKWTVMASPTAEYFSTRRTAAPYIIFTFGSLFVVAVAAYTLLVLRHTGIVEHMVEEKTNELMTAKHELELLTKIDSLTGLYNRRYFDEYLQQEWKRALREKTPISIMMIDIDHFKFFNDHYGHLIGDDCLKTIAATLLKSAQRSTDIVARYGGEEFIMILPNTAEPLPIAEKCRAAVEQLAIPHRHSPPPQIVTVSIGVSYVVPKRGIDPSELIHNADMALYKAKQQGRNRVEFQF
jgi:diguanylate cyclase (GGDEF)-like protein